VSRRRPSGPRRPGRPTPSPGERTLSCRHFGRCGGCSRLDVPIGEQVAAKCHAVRELLSPHLPRGLDVVPAHAIPHAPPRHDRTKVAYPAGRDADGRLTLGLYARGSHDLVSLRSCEIQHPLLTALADPVARACERAGMVAYEGTPAHERPDAIRLRAMTARIAPGTGELLLGLTTTGGVWPEAPHLAEEILATLERLAHGARVGGKTGPAIRPVGIVRNIHDEPGNFLLGRRQLALRGRDHQFDRADGLTFRITFGCFYQVHRRADRLLYRAAITACGPLAGKRFVDAYGGVGTFALRALARGAERVDLLEEHPRACADAEASVVHNDLPRDRLHVHQGPVTADPSLFAAADVVLVDPPRSGLGEEVAAALAAAAPPRIVYVACSAKALARDLAVLVGAGYCVERVETIDLFPHTEHVEVLCVLSHDPAGA
jgi:23S rRNA (uracil1939-C5)-methyltransferase